MKQNYSQSGDLFGPELFLLERRQSMGPGAVLLREFASHDGPELIRDLSDILLAAPFRHMSTPGGFRMSVAMTNCGRAGWVSDADGYRYQPVDPTTGLQMAWHAHFVQTDSGCCRSRGGIHGIRTECVSDQPVRTGRAPDVASGS